MSTVKVSPPPRGCQWIDGDPKRDVDWTYCGARSIAGTSWCEEHYHRVYASRDELRQKRNFIRFPQPRAAA